MSRGKAIYPGSFDPITVGHLDVIARAAQLFDSVIVAIAQNDAKQPLFSVQERMDLVNEAVSSIPGVEVKGLDGLLVDFCRKEDVFVVLRGLRAVSDFEFEFQMALMNRQLEPRLETVFLTPKEDYSYLSSRLVKEVARLGGNIDPFVPASVAQKLRAKFSQ